MFTALCICALLLIVMIGIAAHFIQLAVRRSATMDHAAYELRAMRRSLHDAGFLKHSEELGQLADMLDTEMEDEE